ncbi:MAG: hypothetical protein WCG16_03135 [Methylococcales bacterium]
MVNNDFEVNSNDYEAKLYELEILQLWDNLPDYCKTAKTLEKIKAMTSQSLLNKLTTPESLIDDE